LHSGRHGRKLPKKLSIGALSLQLALRLIDCTMPLLDAYAAKAERCLDALPGVPAAHPAGRELQRQAKARRGKFFVFLSNRRVPPTNNVSKQLPAPLGWFLRRHQLATDPRMWKGCLPHYLSHMWMTSDHVPD
jgi:hypothetical protein